MASTGRIDYRMQRRAAIAAVREGDRSPADACDAHPDLLRAGEHLGSEVDDPCPICSGDRLRHVHYLFFRRGKSTQGGRAVAEERIPDELARHGSIRRYLVEVCLDCQWHHLLELAQLERPVRQRPRVAPRRKVEDGQA